MTRELAILGSTGSIGRSVLDVVRQHPERLRVRTLAAWGSNPDAIVAQIAEFRPELVAVFDENAAARVREAAPDGVEVSSGAGGLREAATHGSVDKVVAAMVGAAGLPPVHAALAAGKDVALANKESLVVAGKLLTTVARQSGAAILPIDSEHAALHQALRCGEPAEVRRLVLTASGGPFRTRDLSTWAEIRPEEALAHPTWNMGAKISIDSATLMNKGLELIEATHLFSVDSSAVDVVVHPQSIVHSMVEYRDGSWIAQLSVNDMVFPIQYALAYPERWDNQFERLDPRQLGRLEFEPVDDARFPALGLVREALRMGDSGPAVLNAANEEAVNAFLEHKIAFPDIVSTVASVLEQHQTSEIETLEQALECDAWARERARETLARNMR